MTRLRLLLFIAGVLLLVREAEAWSGAGHMLIAAGAYKELPAAVRKKVDAILQAHPEYEPWKESCAGDQAGVDLGMYVFMQASKWPDEIRRKHSSYDHPHWHYVNYPLKPPKFPEEPSPSPEDDVVFGIGKAEGVVADAKASAEERAAYLSWLIHLVGDIHQPLHCATLVDSEFPNGRAGMISMWRPRRAG